MSDLIIKYGKNEVSIANKEDLFQRKLRFLIRGLVHIWLLLQIHI